MHLNIVIQKNVI
uniref:Uncharacterized protein n=1 Tax=Anguilla anguilla TaxID=7936 RepID=A0A0E9TIX1_ANGAN